MLTDENGQAESWSPRGQLGPFRPGVDCGRVGGNKAVEEDGHVGDPDQWPFKDWRGAHE